MSKIIPYGRQFITEDDIQAVVEVLSRDFLTQGPKVEEFEKYFSSVVNSKFSIAVTNGTAALHLSMLALGLKPGDRVLCTTNSFAASANCVLYCGADVEFVDIEPESFCIDIHAIEEKLKLKPKGYYKGVIAVDLAGYPVDFEKIRVLADEYGMWVVEDTCHALGASYINSKGEKVLCGQSRYVDLSTFSFHPVKHITTGEGGMITTNRQDLYEKLLQLRSHGITKSPEKMNKYDGGWYYEMQTLGFNYRISDILCALGLSQLKRLESNIRARQKIASVYNQELKQYLELPKVDGKRSHGYHLYVVRSDRRDELYNYLKSHNITCQVHYIPIHKHPFYVNKYGQQSFPNAETYYKKALSLPMFHSLKESDQLYVIEKVRKFFSSAGT